ncbi:MAG: hypothetical protein Q4A37_01200 [Candidatus Saccharibacteria bacterium]|nr:hypothetical protein [Candidatus Saccharibacteria bacterium]
MVIEFLLNLFFGLLNIIFALVSIPAAPLEFTNAINNLLPYFVMPIAVIRVYVGESFFTAIFTMILAAFVLFISLRPGMWLYNKLRGSGN